MSAFDPKRTFRLRILTSIKFKVVAHKLSSITDWLSEKPAPVTVSARLLLPPPFNSNLNPRRAHNEK